MWQTVPDAATGDWKTSVADSIMSRVRRISSSDDDDERSRRRLEKEACSVAETRIIRTVEQTVVPVSDDKIQQCTYVKIAKILETVKHRVTHAQRRTLYMQPACLNNTGHSCE